MASTSDPDHCEASPPPAPPPDAGSPDDFERYVLMGLVTLVILCVIAVDRFRDRQRIDGPEPGSVLEVVIGGPAIDRPAIDAPEIGGPNDLGPEDGRFELRPSPDDEAGSAPLDADGGGLLQRPPLADGLPPHDRGANLHGAEGSRVDRDRRRDVEDAAGWTPEPRPEPAPKVREYVIQPSDTLSEIAQRELGSASRMHEIIALNGSELADPDTLQVGQTLRLPPVAR